jgi:hypothetical protein
MASRALCFLAAVLTVLPTALSKDWESPEFKDAWLYKTDLVIPPKKTPKWCV